MNTVNEEHGTLIVRLHGDVDLEHSAKVRQLLLQQVDTGKPVLVDLSGVNYIDSSGIANLVEALQAAQARNARFRLVAVSQQAMRVLRLARLDKVFDIRGDIESALDIA